MPRGTHSGISLTHSLTPRENNALFSRTTQNQNKETKTSSAQEEEGGASPKPKEIKRREVFNLLRSSTKVQP